MTKQKRQIHYPLSCLSQLNLWPFPCFSLLNPLLCSTKPSQETVLEGVSCVSLILFSLYLTCCISNIQHQFPLSPSRSIFFPCLLQHSGHLFLFCDCFFSVFFYKCISVTQLLNSVVSGDLVLTCLLFSFFSLLSCVITSVSRASITTY